MNRSLLLALVLTFSFGCGRPSPAPEAPPCSSCPIAWTVTGETSELTLLGTVHTLGRDEVDLKSLARLKTAQRFVMEADFRGDAVYEIDKRMLLPVGGPTLEVMLGEDDWRTLSATVTSLGPPEAMKYLQPWYVLMALLQQLLPPAGRMDEGLRSQMEAAGVEVQYLETAAEQLDLVKETLGVEALREVLRDPNGTKASVKTIEDAWRAGDLELLAALTAGHTPEEIRQNEVLVTLRNHRWLGNLEQSLAEKQRVFVAVGAAHLVGPEGLVALLRAKGYAVERVPATPAQ